VFRTAVCSDKMPCNLSIGLNNFRRNARRLSSMARDLISLCVTYMIFVKKSVSYEARYSTVYNKISQFLVMLFNKDASY